jgi:type I restriction enzyme M protein
VQHQIVAELDGYRKVIEGARQVVASYKPVIRIDPAWPTVKLGKLVRINNGGLLTRFEADGRIACIKVSDMNLPANRWEITTSFHWTNKVSHEIVPVRAVIFPKRGAAIATNKKRLTAIPCLIDNNCMGLIVVKPEQLEPEYLFYFLHTFDLASISNSAGIPLINNDDINEVSIPLPDLTAQRDIVHQFTAERALVDANHQLIELFERKIQDRLAEIWGEAGQTA